MSVVTSNPFALLGDNDEVESQPAATSAPKKNEPAKAAPLRQTGTGRSTSGRGGHVPLRPEDERGPSGSNRGGHRGKGGETRDRARSHGGRAGYSGRNRAFDRRSGTGKTDSEKKIHQGWGDARTAEEEGEKLAKDEQKEETGAGSGDNAVNGDNAADATTEAKPVEADPEDNFKTLDEYLAEKAQKKLSVSALAPRQANEGVDDSQWKDTVKLEKAEDEDYFSSSKESKQRQKARKEKQTLIIEQRFTEPPRRGGRGGEGRGRGGFRGGARGGRGENRGGRGGRFGGRGGQNVNLNDQSAFPSLGA